MLSDSKNKNYWSLISFLTIIIAIAIGYFFIYPNIDQLKNLNIQIYARDKENQAMEVKIVDLRALKAAFDQNPQKVGKFDLAMPKNDAMPDLLVSLEEMSQKSALSMPTVANKSKSDGKYTSINIAFEGSYESLKMFLDDLENNIRLVAVSSISLSTKDVKADNSTIQGNMTLDFFKVTPKQITTAVSIEEE